MAKFPSVHPRMPQFLPSLIQIKKIKLTCRRIILPTNLSLMPTPLFYDNHFFILSDLRKNLSKIVPEKYFGSKLDLPGKYKWRASPTAADDKIFLMNQIRYW